jgi:outer membrane lipoprotein-sorting protein/peroxiredoxin
MKMTSLLLAVGLLSTGPWQPRVEVVFADPGSPAAVAGSAGGAAFPADQDASKAKDLLEAVAAAMKDAGAISYETEIRTRIESLEVAQKAIVVLKRPDLARLELSGAGQDGLIVLDGVSSWHYLKGRNRFAKARQLGTIKIQQYGAGPVASLFFEKGTGTLAPYLSDATVTQEKLGADDCSLITWKVGNEETRVWVCGKRLRRYTTVRTLDGRRFEQTFDHGVVDVSPKIADDVFTFAPPAGAQPLGAGDDSKLLAVGANAPDLRLTALDGTPLKLADVEGKPVLLTFWFYACATCREELRRIEKLRASYEPRGVVIIAVNFGDAPDVIRTYFEKESFGFMPALQKAKEMTNAYGVQAYPTNYVLGADRRVVMRSVGFDEPAVRKALDEVAPAK